MISQSEVHFLWAQANLCSHSKHTHTYILTRSRSRSVYIVCVYYYVCSLTYEIVVWESEYTLALKSTKKKKWKKLNLTF